MGPMLSNVTVDKLHTIGQRKEERWGGSIVILPFTLTNYCVGKMNERRPDGRKDGRMEK